jgi:hypothetical protein
MKKSKSKHATLLMIALLSTGCSVIIELPYESFHFPEEYPMAPQHALTQDLALMTESQVDLIFEREVRNTGGEAPSHDLQTTLNQVEKWIREEQESRRSWTLKIVRQSGGAYLVHLHNNRWGERASHSHRLQRSLKMTTILANRMVKGQE